MKKQYIKRNFKYWTFKKLNKHSLKIWYTVAVCMALVTVWAVINRQVNKGGLVSPLVTNPVTPVYASEKVIIKCELGVPEYLECKAAQGVITYKQAEIMTAIAYMHMYHIMCVNELYDDMIM